jgi:hypothetical protein
VCLESGYKFTTNRQLTTWVYYTYVFLCYLISIVIRNSSTVYTRPSSVLYGWSYSNALHWFSHDPACMHRHSPQVGRAHVLWCVSEHACLVVKKWVESIGVWSAIYYRRWSSIDGSGISDNNWNEVTEKNICVVVPSRQVSVGCEFVSRLQTHLTLGRPESVV